MSADRADNGTLPPEVAQRLADMGIVASRWQEMLVRYKPEVLEGYLEWSGVARGFEVLTPRVRELIVIAIDCVLNWPSPYIDQHFVNASRLGTPIKEMVEVCVTAGHIGGPHAMTHGLSVLSRLLADGRIPDDPREEVS
jgi:alkylhydroperoxidase/carboxymuconolactone decarboxylase family protein YurZ